MTLPEKDVDSFIDALRSDLPSAEDDARLRARLVGAGLAIGAGLATPSTALGATAAVAAGTQGGLFSKIAALSWTAKVGLATAAVAATSALPVASHYASREDAKPVDRAAASTPQRLAAAPMPERPSVERPATEEARPTVEEPVAREPQAVRVPREGDAPSPRTRPPEIAAVAEPPANTSSVGAFPSVESTAPSNATLRVETELVERALSAFRSGDRATASRFLLEHARRFPNGLLARDRDRALARVNESPVK